MAKDIKKKFTITLDIGTDDAEKQLKSAADSIRKSLKAISDGGNSLQHFKDLSNLLAQIDTQMAALKTTYGTDFEVLFNKISTSIRTEFQNAFNFASQQLDEFNANIQADKTHLDALNTMLSEYKKAAKVGEQAFNMEKITGFKGTKKEVQELYAAFDKLVEAKKGFEDSGDFTSEAYIKNYIQLMRTAAGIINADIISADQGKDFGIDVSDLSAKAEQAKKIIHNMFGSLNGPDAASNVFQQINSYINVTKVSLESWAEALANVMGDAMKSVMSGSTLAAQNKQAAESYDQLAAKVKEYIDVQKQLQTLEKGSKERKDALKRAGQIQMDIIAMKDLDENQEEDVYGIFEKMNSGAISSADAIAKLCEVLQIDIPGGFSGASQAASASFNTITKGANNASKAMQKVMYHLGNLLNGKGKKQDTFDEMPYNLTEAVEGNDKYAKYGFGVLGGGLFGVSDPSTIDQSGVVSSKLIHGIDISKYNMYMADTEERAVALMDFLSKLQKYAMKQAEPNYKGFDEQLDGVDIGTLYDQFKVVFNESDLTKEKFNNFLEDMVGLLRQAGLKFDADFNELIFTSIGNLEGSENISTRFMKMLGYHGVNVGGTSFDGFGQGSVLFDFKESDLVSYFNSVGQAVDDFNKRINDANWDGTTEQLKQYRANIDDIIARLQEYEQKYQKPSITQNVNETVAKLTQTKSIIDQLLSGDNAAGSSVVEAENKQLRELNAALQASVDAGGSNGEHEELAKENTQLERKLELLQDIATQYGISITKKDRDRHDELVEKEMSVGLTQKEEDRLFELGEKIEEADAALEELGETYDKIIIKLANGKKVEILPDDKGLRALDKIANEYYTGEYNGQDIQDIVFIRKQEQEVVSQTNQQLQDQLQIQKRIADTQTASTTATDSAKKVAAAYDRIFDVLQNIGNQWKDLDTVDSAIGSIPLSDVDTYVKELERLIKLIESVDPNFQYGDKYEYDGAVKTLEKLQVLFDRTKLTDEFKNTINQFEQLGKFQWSDELTNGYVKILKDIRNGTYTTIGQCVAKFNELSAAAAEPQVMDTATAFKELVNYVSKSGYSPASFFDKLEDGALGVSDALKEILVSLGLIDANGKVSLSSLTSGFTNKGGFVSDQYTMIARPDYYLAKIQSIQPKLQSAQKEGAQIGAIFDIIEDKSKGLIYEIQNTVPGKSVLGHHSQATNQDILNATDEHIDGLISTLQILQKNGLFIDWGGDNILYDPQKGFSVIDLGDKGGKYHTVSAQNTMQENLDRMAHEIFAYDKGMGAKFQAMFIDRLYASAQKIDPSIVNPYAPKQTGDAKTHAQNAQAKNNEADAQERLNAAKAAEPDITAAANGEAKAHDQSAQAANGETEEQQALNAALQAQIELKKKAQAMKWEAFATDDSLAQLKQTAGMKTLGQLEAFWKKANYEKDVDFHEISEAEAKQILKDKLPKGLASAWYGSADFTAKSKLENEVLADNEIRNAAMNFLYYLYKKMPTYQQDPNVQSFMDFLETEFTVYRGDSAPLIYDDQSKLSFSFKKSIAESFEHQLGTAKIKPKNTIGNAGSGFYSEVETFIPSDQTSWYQKTSEAFEDFYSQQTKEMQKEIDAGLVNFEKKRVADIIGDELATLTHQAGKDASWQQKVARHISQGVVPDQLDVLGDSSAYDEFATAYNGLSDTMKKFVMFFASMDALSTSLPKQFSISSPATSGHGFLYGKSAVGEGAKLFNAILNDPEGRNQHIARLTGEYAFNLLGQTPQDINAEADAHERNAQAIRTEAQAQQDLNKIKDAYDQVMYDLWDSAVDARGAEHTDLSKLWSLLHDVQHSDQSILDQGLYTQKSTGDTVQATDLFQLVVDIEQKYNKDLAYVRDYLKQVYSGIDFGNIIPTVATPTGFDATKLKVYETAKNAYKSGNQREYFKILGVLNYLNDVNAASSEDIANAQYTDTDTDRIYNISDLIGMVKSIEDAYGENFDYVYDYLKQVYGEATVDNALANLSNNGISANRRPEKQYTVADYEAAYVAAPDNMLAAIDDLALFHHRYEQLYALTNTRPIDITFPGIPNMQEIQEVLAIFDKFKAKQREIFQLQLVDYDGNKEKIQELQAEVIGLQNKLKGASLGEDADVEKYKAVYGFTFDQDAERFKNLVDMTENVHTVMEDMTRVGEKKMSLIPQEMQDMLDSDNTGAGEYFLAQLARSIKDNEAAAQQANAGADATERQLQTEQDITAEKQKQVAIDQQQSDQATTDTVKTQIQAQDVQAEAVAMSQVLQQVEAVKDAVMAKTAAFEAEGVAVEEAVSKEIAALTQLKTLLDSIQNSLQLIFAANNRNIGDVNLSQDKTSSNAMPNVLQEIKTILGQIYGVLSKFTGVESANKNSAEVKAPVVDNNTAEPDAYKYLADKLPKDVATESTLSTILSAVNQLVKAPENSDEADLKGVAAALVTATTELRNVANGIVLQQKASKSDTSVAQARIGDKDEYVKIKSAALGSLGNRALESEVTEMKALANGVVQVTGWLKVAEDAWEGFTVKVNEANVASGLAFEQNTKAAKQAAAAAKATNNAVGNTVGKGQSGLDIAREYYNAFNIPDTQKDFFSNKLINTVLNKVFGKNPNETNQFYFTGSKDDANVWDDSYERALPYYEAIDKILQLIGYHLSEIKPNMIDANNQWGFTAEVVANSENFVTNFEQAKEILFELNAESKRSASEVDKIRLHAQATSNQAQKPQPSYSINKNAYGATSVSTIQGRFNTLASQAQQYAASGWEDIAAAYQKAETALQNLIALQSQFQGKKMPDNHSQFVQYRDACNAANKELKKLLENADEFKKNAVEGSITDVQGDINVNSRSSRGEALQTYVQEMYGSKAIIRGFNDDMTELQFIIRNTDGTIENMTAAFNSAKTQIGALHGETKKAVTVFDLLGSKFAELWRYATARMGVDEVIQAVRKGVEYVREIDAALTDLKKVTNETDATYAQFLQTMSQTAGKVGSTVAELTTMAGEWARLGYSLQEAGMLAESTAILLNVSEFDDATTASEALISTMQAFGYAADESQHVVDILNEVGFKMPRLCSNIQLSCGLKRGNFGDEQSRG